MRWIRKLFFDISYLMGSARWDTGITPPELVEFIAAHPPGRALDLGCGTGTNLVALAEAGWDVVGVDFARRAVRAARDRLRKAGLSGAVYQDDVSKLRKVDGAFELVLDIGCFHSLDPAQQEGYAQQLARRLAPGGTFLLYAFQADEAGAGPGVRPETIDRLFGELSLQRREEGTDGPHRMSVWHWFVR